jgi:hypothetical protein
MFVSTQGYDFVKKAVSMPASRYRLIALWMRKLSSASHWVLFIN